MAETPTVKRGRGRPPGSKNKPKTVEAVKADPVAAKVEASEFLPRFNLDPTNPVDDEQGEPEAKPDDEDIKEWARRLIRSGEFRQGIEAAARSGLLPARMFEWLLSQARTEERIARDRSLMDFATSTERWIILNITRRAKNLPEIGFRLPGAIRDVTLPEMIEATVSQPGVARRR